MTRKIYQLLSLVSRYAFRILRNPSTATRLLKALTEKELLLETKSLNGSSYSVYNVFFSRWLERL